MIWINWPTPAPDTVVRRHRPPSFSLTSLWAGSDDHDGDVNDDGGGGGGGGSGSGDDDGAVGGGQSSICAGRAGRHRRLAIFVGH